MNCCLDLQRSTSLRIIYYKFIQQLSYT